MIRHRSLGVATLAALMARDGMAHVKSGRRHSWDDDLGAFDLSQAARSTCQVYDQSFVTHRSRSGDSAPFRPIWCVRFTSSVVRDQEPQASRE